MFKTVLILANSIKHHGYCVAGKELMTKNWIRFHLIFYIVLSIYGVRKIGEILIRLHKSKLLLISHCIL